MNFHRVQDGNIAYDQITGNKFDLVFLPGLKSDRMGAKALYLERYAEEHDLGNIRFDYLGHGDSDGNFAECGIDEWLENSLNVINNLAQNPVILIGSSLGGWLALLAAQRKQTKIKALITLAAAPDFTENLIWGNFSDDIKAFIHGGGIYNLPSDDCDGEYPISKKLIESGRQHLLLNSDDPIKIDIPSFFIHGEKDKDVPFETSMKIFGKITSEKKKLILRKNSDHRLSSDSDLRILASVIDGIIS
ncbi:MAG: alpha/beta hydrolase [Rickettsiales bacterium]|jgi:esterase/lipase|nr:alpha/beta hydrolase [Rickettsiales bacterium]